MKSEICTPSESPVAARNNVVHRNDLFLKNGGSFSVSQLRVFLYVVSQLPKMVDTELPLVQVDESTLAALLCLNTPRRTWICRFRQVMEDLASLPVVVTDSDGGTVITTWFKYIRIPQDGRCVQFQFNPILTPFFMRLTGQFTIYELGYVLTLTSSHSIRLYDLMKSVSFRGSYIIDADELRRYLGLVRYDEEGAVKEYKFPETKRLTSKVISPAVEEINEKTDILVSYRLVRGNAPAFEFTITAKEGPPPLDLCVPASKFVTRGRPSELLPPSPPRLGPLE